MQQIQEASSFTARLPPEALAFDGFGVGPQEPSNDVASHNFPNTYEGRFPHFGAIGSVLQRCQNRFNH